jgi:hypothetical protein
MGSPSAHRQAGYPSQDANVFLLLHRSAWYYGQAGIYVRRGGGARLQGVR